MMDKILWAKAGVIDSDDAKLYEEIERVEKDCAPFNITTKVIDEKWGIWMQIGDEELLVDPIELTSSLFKKDDYFHLLMHPDIKGGHFVVYVRLEDHVWKWTLSHTALDFKGTRTFKRGEYVEKVINSLDSLYQACIEGKQLAYEKPDAETLRICAEQAKLFSYLGSHVRVRSNQIQVEELHFDVIPGHAGEHYSIKIGSRGYETWCTHWDNDEERNRHQFETITFYDETAEIHLTFDMSDTIIRLKPVNVLKSIDKTENGGYSFDYEDLMLVDIEPNEFVNMPIIKGYCNRKQCVQALYQGLLSLTMDCPIEQDSEYHSDPPARLVAYNRIKSPMIENYLGDIREDVRTRQVRVKHILTIDPDVDQIFVDEEGVSWDASREGGLYNIYGREGQPIVMPELKQWADEVVPAVCASDTSDPFDKDWADYHKRGLALAHRLREKLSTDFDLWYSAPSEDKSGTMPQTMLIL